MQSLTDFISSVDLVSVDLNCCFPSSMQSQFSGITSEINKSDYDIFLD